MKKKTIVFLIALVMPCVLVGGYAGRMMLEDSRIRSKRDHVHSLIFVGQDISDAQYILRENGYDLAYENPIRPTRSENYVQQLVEVGETNSGIIDTLFYIIDGGSNPFRKESPYIVIDAGDDGVVTRIN